VSDRLRRGFLFHRETIVANGRNCSARCG
jgi:hypothetical protein